MSVSMGVVGQRGDWAGSVSVVTGLGRLAW